MNSLMQNIDHNIDHKPFELIGLEPGARVAVAMSGGVDSSVVACLAHEAGFEVIGITLQLYNQGELAKKKGACCAGQDIYDAKMIADKMNFKHFVLDYETKFKQSVIDDFADSYLKGETPLPCVRCNQNIKFKDLLTTAKDFGAKALITGHYVQQKMISENHFAMYKAFDEQKDQSYFLFATTQEQLNYLRFPLGAWQKATTRYHAKRFELKVADKPDSQDICFVPNGSYANLVAKLRPGALDAGLIKTSTGKIIGQHNGIINFTIGQRKGLDLKSLPKGVVGPLYVLAIDAATNTVIAGSREQLAIKQIWLKDLNWLGNEMTNEIPVWLKVRSQQKALGATLTLSGNNQAFIELDQPEFGVSAGQAAVCYAEDGKLLGGGWITNQHLQKIIEDSKANSQEDSMAIQLNVA